MNNEQVQALLEKISSIQFSRFMVAGMLMAGFYYFVAFDSGASYDAQIETVRTELNKETQRLSETESLISDGKKFEEQLKFINDQFTKALEYLPKDLNMSDLAKKITAEAKASGSQVVSMKPKAERAQFEFYEELLIDLELRGSFAELTMFLSYISKIPRILKIKKISMAKNQVGSEGNVEVLFAGQVAAYRYLEGAKSEGK